MRNKLIVNLNLCENCISRITRFATELILRNKTRDR